MLRQFTVSRVLDNATKYLRAKGIKEARVDAEVLLAHVLKIERAEVYLNLDCQLNDRQLLAFKKLIERRGKREPVAYIIGWKEFMGLKFFLNKHVLIPRPETELLVERAIEKAKHIINNGKYEIKIIDLCTGSGNIAVSLAKNIEFSRVYATDISERAIKVAKKNAKFHNVDGQIEFLVGDLFKPLEGIKPDLQADIVVANPPYIKPKEFKWLQPEVRKEPLLALKAGEEGLFFYKRIVPGAVKYLIKGGCLILEIGDTQAESVVDLVRKEGFSTVRVIKDYAGLDRIVEAQK